MKNLAKQAAKDTSYGLVVVAGFAIVGIAGYFLYKEIFTRETPTGIYSESSKICLDNIQVTI